MRKPKPKPKPKPHPAMARIKVFMQPGMEAVISASPLIGKPEEFGLPEEILGKLVMNGKHSLWFIDPDGVKVWLAKSPIGALPAGKKRKEKGKVK